MYPSFVPTISARRSNTSNATEPIILDKTQIAVIGQYHNIQQRLRHGLSQIPEAKRTPRGVPIETVLDSVKSQSSNPGADGPFVRILEEVYAGKHFEDVDKDLTRINKHRRPSLSSVEDEDTIRILNKLRLVQNEADFKDSKSSETATITSKQRRRAARSISTNMSVSEGNEQPEAPLTLRERAKIRPVATKNPLVLRKQSSLSLRKLPSTISERPSPLKRIASEHMERRPTKASAEAAAPLIVEAPPDAKSLDGSFIAQSAIEKEATLPVPKLSFDLSRVLFNPGVYHLQDPRSRVYNFDPYLEKIMPVSEFNFEALNPYITSSQDDHLRNVSMKHNKRYIGSSSSMSGVMSHFHFLLSAWRPLDMSMLSKKIEGNRNFTVITRAPSGIFLRWRDGVYAVDADKEHDTPNILMMQGKSMEKLLTLEKEDFEKYRKPKVGEQAPAIDSDPESYHYSGCENFLLRSQLDAWDPRLPGTGMFDLKTRACAGIRMDMTNHENGMGYQIKERFGEWESFDREYFDMMRAAFLKYSLQVRMGRMDGIFVAYHNIERIFGFQYIPLSELDAGLHGQSDPCVGDREFKMTVKLMNEVFDLATKEYPKQSLRFIFETRDPTKTDPNGVMRIFAEPMSEAKIDKIQNKGKARVEEYEKNMAMGFQQQADGQNMGGQTLEAKLSPSTLESNSADIAFLEEIMRQEDVSESRIEEVDSTPDTMACWTIRIYNEVNGRPVVRPQNIKSSDRWIVKYEIGRVADTQARGLYNSCKNRRAAAFGGGDAEAKKENFFIQRIRQMSEAGRAWRDRQDEKDAQREKVMLYEPAGRVTPDSP